MNSLEFPNLRIYLRQSLDRELTKAIKKTTG